MAGKGWEGLRKPSEGLRRTRKGFRRAGKDRKGLREPGKGFGKGLGRPVKVAKAWECPERV